MEHLLNCHNEWGTLLLGLTALPFLGPWLRARLRVTHHDHKV